MAHMPTTRRGRFLFYRARQRRRLEKARRRATAAVFSSDHGYEAATKRSWDLSEYTKQMHSVYPLHPNQHWGGVVFGVEIVRRHAKGLFDYLVLPSPPFYPPDRNSHFKVEVTRGYFRRLKSIPRLRHIPRLPWRHTHAELGPRDYFPFPFYPSGAPSYRSTLGP